MAAKLAVSGNNSEEADDVSWDLLSQQHIDTQKSQRIRMKEGQSKSTLEKMISQAQDGTISSEEEMQCQQSQTSRKRLFSTSSGSDNEDQHEWQTKASKGSKPLQKRINPDSILHSLHQRDNKSNPKFVIFTSPEVKLAKISPIKIARELNKLGQGFVKSVSKNNQGGISVQCHTSAQALKLKETKQLGEWIVKADFAKSETQSKGVISGVPLDVSEEEIVSDCREFGVTAARRITRRRDGQLTKTLSVCLTFNSPKMPSYVKLGYLIFETKPFIPPVVRCYNCQRIGHVADGCRSKTRCVRCSGPHKFEECPDKDKVLCCRCGEEHSSAYAGCKVMKEERKIQEVKVTLNISYAEAAKSVRQTDTSKDGEKESSETIPTVHVSNTKEQDDTLNVPKTQDINRTSEPVKRNTHQSLKRNETRTQERIHVSPKPSKPITKITQKDAYTQTDREVECQTEITPQYFHADRSLITLFLGILKIWESKSGVEREGEIKKFIENIFHKMNRLQSTKDDFIDTVFHQQPNSKQSSPEDPRESRVE